MHDLLSKFQNMLVNIFVVNNIFLLSQTPFNCFFSLSILSRLQPRRQWRRTLGKISQSWPCYSCYKCNKLAELFRGRDTVPLRRSPSSHKPRRPDRGLRQERPDSSLHRPQLVGSWIWRQGLLVHCHRGKFVW